MGRLIWDNVGEKTYETGLDRGVLYPMNTETNAYDKGVVWNGLSKVSEKPSGAETTDIYADNIKYLNLLSAEKFAATVEAYTYPDEFAVCDGTAEPVPGMIIGQQVRKTFGMSYRTLLGNDVAGQEYGYKIHCIYGAVASPSEKGYQSVNESPEAITFSWEVNTTPVPVTGFKPTASLTIDSTKVSKEALAAIEAILYGSDEVDARLPLPDEIAGIINPTAQG